MVPMGPSTPIGGAQSAPPSLLRTNSGMLGSQGGGLSSQSGFSSLVSPRTQFNNMNMLGNVPNVASLLNQSFGNGGPGSSQRGGIDTGAESEPLSNVGTVMGFNAPSSSFVPSNMANPGSSGQVQGQQFSDLSGNHISPDQQQPQQPQSQHFQHGHTGMQQVTAPHNTQQGQLQQQQQQQFQSIRGGLAGAGAVKLEPQQLANDQQQQQLQSLRNLAPVKLEPQQIVPTRTLPQVKMEPQHSDQSLFLHQQQQQLLQMSRQSPQTAAAQINLLHQQRLLQLQQQQQLLKAMPQQRTQLPQQFQKQNLPLRSPVKSAYEPGMCARRLTHYMYQQQHRPEDNNIEFWRKFVAEYFAPNAKKKWCVSMYGSGRQTTGVFPQDVWHCEICNRKPGRGFEATVEVLPRLFKIKYESGTLEELLYVDMPREYQNSSGQIVLDYAKAIQESVFEQLRVVRDGQLRIVFSPDLKICSWEFCARRHEELIPRRLLIPQVSQLGAAAQKYQAATQNASTNLSAPDLQNNCNLFVASARQLAKALEVPLVNDLGYTKRYVRCLQISEVVNSMKDLIDYSRETRMGPMESLAKFPRRTRTSSGFHAQAQQPEEQLQQQTSQQQMMAQNSNGDQTNAQASGMQVAANNSVVNMNNSLNVASTSTSAGTISGHLHHNFMSSRQQNSMNNASRPYGGNSAQIPSPGSSTTIPQTQANPSPFQSPTPSSSNNPPQAPNGALVASSHMSSANSPAINLPMQQPALSGEADPNDSQSSVQKIIHEIMSSQLSNTSGMVGTGTLGNEVKSVNGMLPPSNNTVLNGGNPLISNGALNNNNSVSGVGFSSMSGGIGQSAIVNGIRATMGNNPVMNGRISMAQMARVHEHHQQVIGNQLLNGLEAVNGFNNYQFDWKPSP
ncbi:Transcriptional corepressor SEUSS [Hibiscus syriacus]|uniref:Transcriptional corepressor SEUSS n=1 Tax=Hibiscus syriacus TaxID=106335 RepID=A0A6A2XA77_HIBSY|nr:transcriptional corepressor SEUSS-like [Hibiscus syriacus]XP_039050165.1 transcriptional corepressor SEUSS-like [Hibiscus syriacus]XP_039050166.1 transcriptional corepressor SEUSS-like [Hibiscus syriacus]KAE8659016.1 Transcriptional corepressor SEUSS [Hibiscus syriacus]